MSVEWVDGEWRWRGKRWRWTEGGWYDVPNGASLAHWAVVVRSDGQMLFAPSAWHDDTGKVIATPARLEKGVSNVASLDEPESVRPEPAVHGPDVPANPNAVAGAHATQETVSTQPKSTGSP